MPGSPACACPSTWRRRCLPARHIGLLVELAAADPHAAQALRGHFAFVEDRLSAAPGADRDVWLDRFAAASSSGTR